MKSYALFGQYTWLVDVIHRAGKISLEEINRKWVETDMSEGVPMPRSTFNRHKAAIEDMFGIFIECDRKDGYKYYIGNEEVLSDGSIQNWMLSTLSVGNILSESQGVSSRIILEPVPSTGENLTKFIEAMKSGKRVKVYYRRYGAQKRSIMALEPYLVKLFKQRWYALVKMPAPDSWYFTLAFDRIESLEILDEKFKYNKDFSPSDWFKESYGIVRDKEVAVEKVVIRAFGKEVNYLKDLPFHHSQKEVQSTPDYTDFELTLRPTVDFISPLMSRGSAIKVLSPKWLADRIKQQLKETLELYGGAKKNVKKKTK